MKNILTFCALLVSSFTWAGGEVSTSTEEKDDIHWVDITIKDTPAVYGMEFEILYDHELLTLVDADKTKAGLQIQKGDFFSESTYEILNNVEEQPGRILYAITLLKPATPVSGDGSLARIGFTSTSDDAVKIKLTKVKFGTKQGQIVNVTHPDEISVGSLFFGSADSKSSLFLGMFLVMGIFVLFRRRSVA